jgi:hypothetical protein
MEDRSLYGYSLDEHEFSVEVPGQYAEGSGAAEPKVTIAISAHGGGTVGEAYAGNGWDYLVAADGVPVISGQDLRSAPGKAAGHAEMARSLAVFLSADAETLSRRPADRGSEGPDYSADAESFLIAEGERFSSFADPEMSEAEAGE